ncbi:transketolase [Spiribacter aquaticus]|uniref:Transketolase n=1 Tax=Spiribacter aquaticus TaxID=1935996 RepID=A0A557RND8_9GAMM|nr:MULTISPECIES: transketolase [Spiribacter]KAF0279658.1 transketolase [Spiribacter roseus]TVO66628.1 transketolase [Spiribacter aquaticus]
MTTRRELANAIRALSMDAVQAAQSGHPGAPMGMADIAEVLWNDFLRHNPANPHWPNRDRFVMSNGHGSMLVYSLLHLTGYDVPMEALRQFRQLDSGTPGHPEVGDTPGVETTTGPLGQGLANAVGMALAEHILAGQFNRPGHPLVDHFTYCFLGDGCLMEGISHEACSLAGTLGLGKLVAVYDDNGISIDGKVRQWFTDDTPARFRAYGWHVVEAVDGHDAEAVRAAIETARTVTDRPSLICAKTTIGFGAPNVCGTHGVHGAPLGDDEIQASREFLGWDHPPFEIPDSVYDRWDARARGNAAEAQWRQTLAAYREAHPELAADFERRMAGELPSTFAAHAQAFIEKAQAEGGDDASRKHSQAVLNGFGPHLPELTGGSADLTGSNNTWWKDCSAVSAEDPGGNYLFYGVREFGMTAIMNGMALHGGLIPYAGTFLVFSDYARNAVRMAALMGVRSILVYTHDSIGLGEDGPTHQPIEQLPALRLIPNLDVWRPCDLTETAVAWQMALTRNDGPSAMALSRQKLPHQSRQNDEIEGIRRGGYILREPAVEPQGIIMASGSEVGMAMDAADALEARGHAIRVVSVPCLERFLAQSAAYRESILPAAIQARAAVEAAQPDSWRALVRHDVGLVGLRQFGASAPGDRVYEHMGLTTDAVVSALEQQLEQ